MDPSEEGLAEERTEEASAEERTEEASEEERTDSRDHHSEMVTMKNFMMVPEMMHP